MLSLTTTLSSLLLLAHIVLCAPAPPEPSPTISPVSLPTITAACTTNDGGQTCGLALGQNESTVVVSTNVSSTWSATYYATTFPEYSELTTATTITTTDTAGETILAVILAAGAAWLAVPKPGAPVVDPPEATAPPSMSTPEATSTTTSSTSSPVVQPYLVTLPDKNWQSYLRIPFVSYSNNKLTCDGPGTDSPATVKRDVAISKIESFCKEHDNKAVNKSSPITDEWNVGAGVVMNITVTQFPSCATRDALESTVYTEDCKFFLNRAIDDCDTTTGDKNGGSVDDSCFTWRIKPELHLGELECGKPTIDGTGFNPDEAHDGIKDFCQRFDGTLVSTKFPSHWTYKPQRGNSDMDIAVTYSDDEQCKKPDDEAQYIIDKAACERFLSRTMDECDKNPIGYAGKYGGNVTDDCGVFSLSTKVTEIIQCAYNPYPRAGDISPEAMNAGIKQYCDASFTVDPNYTAPTGFVQDTPKGQSYDNVVTGDTVVRFTARINDGGAQKNCAAPKIFNTQGDECRRRMGAIQTKCGKQGGALSSNYLDGCVMWTMFGSDVS